MKAGETFRGHPGNSVDQHLWIVLADEFDGLVPCVNISSFGGRLDDPTCSIEAGEHPFVNHRSFVVYSKARLVRVADLDAAERDHLIRWESPLAKGALERVISGAVASTLIPENVRNRLL